MEGVLQADMDRNLDREREGDGKGRRGVEGGEGKKHRDCGIKEEDDIGDAFGDNNGRRVLDVDEFGFNNGGGVMDNDEFGFNNGGGVMNEAVNRSFGELDIGIVVENRLGAEER